MIAVVKYNAGNTRSVLNALHRLGVEAVVTDDAAQLRQADRAQGVELQQHNVVIA